MSKPRIIDVIFMAYEIWPVETAWEWFMGSNDYLDGRQPWHVLLHGGADEVVKALELEKA